MTSDLLKEQTDILLDDKDKLLSWNQDLQQQQQKLQQEIDKMVSSKTVIERNIQAYDEDDKWQLPEPGVLMSANSYKDKKVKPFVKKLKEVIKSLLIKCINLMSEVKWLTDQMNRQGTGIGYLTDRVREQANTIEKIAGKRGRFGTN